MECHYKILKSNLIKKEKQNILSQSNRYFYYCPISREKIYINKMEIKIMKKNKKIFPTLLSKKKSYNI